MAAPNRGQIVASAWEDYVKQDPTDNINAEKVSPRRNAGVENRF